MSKEEFAVFAGKYMDMIYRVAYSWMKNSHDAGSSDTTVQDNEGI